MISLPDADDRVPIKLSVADRYLLSCLLPRHGTRQMMVAADQIDRLIAFDQREIDHFGITYEPDGAMRAKSDEAIEFSFSVLHLSLIKQAIDLADEQGRISRDMLPLLTKIDALTSVPTA